MKLKELARIALIEHQSVRPYPGQGCRCINCKLARKVLRDC